MTQNQPGDFWVIFDGEGRASHFSLDPRPGAVLVRGVDPDVLITCRLVDDQWIPREVVPPPEPTSEEIAARAEAEWQAILAARDAAIDAAILASPAYRQFIRAQMTQEAFAAAVAAIEAGFLMPERPA